MCGFKPGDEVVCVDATLSEGRSWIGDPPVEGAIYTIRAVGVCRYRDASGVWLHEIRNDGDGVDDAYWAARFRKVERRNDSLSIEAFLTIKPGFEEPKRSPAKKRETAE